MPQVIFGHSTRGKSLLEGGADAAAVKFVQALDRLSAARARKAGRRLVVAVLIFVALFYGLPLFLRADPRQSRLRWPGTPRLGARAHRAGSARSWVRKRATEI